MTSVHAFPVTPHAVSAEPTPVLNAPPSARTIMAEQLRLSGLLLRGGGAFFVVLLVLLVAVPAITISGAGTPVNGRPFAGTNFTFTPEASSAMAFLALIVPLIVWRDEEPTRRDYHWLMPVPRATHTLARVLAGWAWTMFGTLLYVIAIVILTGIAQHVTGWPQRYHPGFSAWEWLVPFGAASVAYALASVAAVSAQRPLIWIFGTAAIYAGTIMALLNRGIERPARVLLLGWSGSLGLRSALYGVWAAAGEQAAPSFWHWAGATALWGAVAGALLWAASSRRSQAR